MKRIVLTAVVILTMVLSIKSVGHAQATSRTSVGPNVALWLNAGKPGIGVDANFILTSDFYFNPGISMVLGISNTTEIILDFNGKYYFPLRGQTFMPYVLGGLAWWHDTYTFQNVSSSSSNFFLNLGGGVTFNTRSSLQPWAGLKITFLNGSDIALQGGVQFFL